MMAGKISWKICVKGADVSVVFTFLHENVTR